MQKKAAVTLDKLPLVAIKNTVMAFQYKDSEILDSFCLLMLFFIIAEPYVNFISVASYSPYCSLSNETPVIPSGVFFASQQSSVIVFAADAM